jgi:CBS domain containing-hemolysin-like protein
LYLLGRFPTTGEQVNWQDYLLTCVEVTPTTILRVKIEKQADKISPG